MTRSCLICGDMICGCTECRNRGLSGIYGICRACIRDVADRMGEQHIRRGDFLETARYASEQMRHRVHTKLEEWSHA